MADDGDDDSRLRAAEIAVAVGGSWRGLLFANPVLGIEPELSWAFTFAFGRVERDWGECDVTLDLDWLPLSAPSWRSMAGQRIVTEGFGEPGEASVHWFSHHRYNSITLRIEEQRGDQLRVAATVRGDHDQLGIDPVAADAWLSFGGIRVSLPGVDDPGPALAMLRDFIEVDGLGHAPDAPGTGVLFTPGPVRGAVDRC